MARRFQRQMFCGRIVQSVKKHGLYRQIARHVTKCSVCKRESNDRHIRHGLKLIRIFLDAFGPLVQHENGPYPITVKPEAIN